MLEHILIVDESRLVREALAKILLSCGISKSDIACIESSEDAIEYAQFSPISLVICSANLSLESYLDFRDELATSSHSKKLPILVVSQQSNEVTPAVLPETNESKVPVNNCMHLTAPLTKQRVIDALFTLTQSAVFAKSNQPDKNLDALQTDENNAEQEQVLYKPTILVVDDESSNIDVVAGNLRNLYRVVAAKSGEHALKIVANCKHNISLILLDIMMPAMDGYQVCKRLKADDDSADIPVIFLSAKALITDIKYGFDLGAVDYITKPLNGDLLRARVATHIRLQQQKIALSAQVDTLKENAKLREDIEKITHHDLKAPLNNILFETYRLEDKKASKSINRAVYNVVNMINNSLNLYKIEHGIYPLMPEETNINFLITDAINAVSSLSNEKEIDFILSGFEVEHAILAEPLLCLSIFNNLIKNAVEASANKHKITISLFEDKNFINFQIINQGVIPHDMRLKLFEKYSSSNHRSGLGLGTYSAKLMAEVQGGTISFEVKDEQKTQFLVQLPAA